MPRFLYVLYKTVCKNCVRKKYSLVWICNETLFLLFSRFLLGFGFFDSFNSLFSGRSPFCQLLESVDPSGGIGNSLFSGVKRMAGWADFHLHFFPGWASLKNCSAGAGDGGRIIIFGMNVPFHEFSMNYEFIIYLPGQSIIQNCNWQEDNICYTKERTLLSANITYFPGLILSRQAGNKG